MIPAARLELGADGPEGQAHVERGLAGAPGVVGLVHGRIPERLDGIPGELHDDAVVSEHDVAHDGAIAIEQGDQGLGRQAVRQGRELPEVHEQHRHLPHLAPEREPPRVGEDPAADAG